MQKHILVVDDDVLLAESIHTYLEINGYAVTSTTHGDDAITILERNHCDLLLCDIHLDGKNGFAVLAACKAIDPNTKVILCSGDIVYPTISMAFKCGADSFLAKPFRTADLLHQVHFFLDDEGKNPQSPATRPRVLKDAAGPGYLC